MCALEIYSVIGRRQDGRARIWQYVRVVLAEVQAAAFVAQQGALHDQFGIHYQVA